MYVHTITKLDPLLVSHKLQGHFLETFFRGFCCDVCGCLLNFAKAILVASTMICGDAKSYLHFRTRNPCCLLQQWGDFSSLVSLVETEESTAASATWTIYISSTIEATSILDRGTARVAPRIPLLHIIKKALGPNPCAFKRVL
jgi:hypothetical protein